MAILSTAPFAMDFAFVLDPLPTLKAYKDSSVAMMRALQHRGHAIYATTLPELYWQGGGTRAVAVRIEVSSHDNENWYIEHEGVDRDLAGFAAVLMRKDPPFDMEYIYASYLLENAERHGARVWNRPGAIRDHSEKMAIAEFAQYVVPTLVSRDFARVGAFIDAERDTILKPLDGMGGTSVFRVRSDDPNRNVILETLSQVGARTVMAQRYIPQISEGDKRVLLIGGKVVPFALARIPKPGETRGNLAVGGRGVAQPLSNRDREIAEALAPTLWKRGLLVVGLDVIGDYLTEINVTSPTCFVEIAEQSGFDVAALFADALEGTLRAA